MTAIWEQVFEQVLRNSAGGALLGGVFLLIALLPGRGIGPRLSVFLAALVFARLLVPIAPGIGPGLFQGSLERSSADTPVPVSLPQSLAIEEIPKGGASFQEAPLLPVEADWLQGIAVPALPPVEYEAPSAVPEITFNRIEEAPAETVTAESAAGLRSFWLPLLWMSGAGLMGVVVMFGSVKFGRRVRRFSRRATPEFVELLDECREQLAIRPPIELRILPGLASPGLFGAGRPVLLLPDDLESRLSREELRAVFLHELAHWKRRDLLWNWLGCFVLCLHWFNPVAWWVVRRFRADRERLCDEMALRFLPNSRTYSETLLKLLRQFAPSHATAPPIRPGFASMVSRKSELKQRLLMIHQPRSQSWFFASFTILFLALVTWVTLPATARDEERGAPPGGERAESNDRDKPDARSERRDGDREAPEARGDREDGPRDHPERRGAGDREHPERGAPSRRDGDRDVPPERRDAPRGDREHGDRDRMPEQHDRVRAMHENLERMHRGLADARRTGRHEEAEQIERRIHEMNREMQHQRAAFEGDRPRIEPDARLHHLRNAAENLEAAGLRDEARRYHEQAERLQREMEAARRPEHAGPGRAEHLEREVRELHEIIGDLRREVHELREQLELERRKRD